MQLARKFLFCSTNTFIKTAAVIFFSFFYMIKFIRCLGKIMEMILIKKSMIAGEKKRKWPTNAPPTHRPTPISGGAPEVPGVIYKTVVPGLAA